MKGRFLWYGLILFTMIVIYGLLDPQLHPFPKCPFRSLTGWLCPGCGSQRAIHHALHGRFAASIQLNPLLLPALVYAFVAFAFSLFASNKWPAVRTTYYGTKAAWISLAIILIFWLVRNIL